MTAALVGDMSLLSTRPEFITSQLSLSILGCIAGLCTCDPDKHQRMHLTVAE
jgi:hypothetical protein